MNKKKISKGLKPEQVKLLNHAWSSAQVIRKPLNTFVTFRPFDDTLSTNDCLQLFRRLRNKIGVYARQHGFTPLFAWSIEANLDGSGLHLHMLVHIPRSKYDAFELTALGWLPGVHEVDVQKVHQRTILTNDGYRHNAISYIAKQMTPQAWYKRGMRRQKGGPVLGKRGGVSRYFELTCPWRKRKTFNTPSTIPLEASEKLTGGLRDAA